MLCISFGRLSFRTFYPLFTSVFYVCRSLIFFNVNGSNFKCPVLFRMLLMAIGMITCYFLEIISMCRQNSLFNTLKDSCKKYFKEYQIMILFFVLGILDCCSFLFFSNFFAIQDNDTEFILPVFRMFELFIVCVISYFLFKELLYLHNYLALILILIGLIFIIPTLAYNEFIWSSLVYGLIAIIFFAILETSEKWIMDKKFFSPHEINFFIGFYSLIISTVFCVVGSFTVCPDWLAFCIGDGNKGNKMINFSEISSYLSENVYYILQVIAFILLTVGYNTFIQLVFKYFTTSHRIIADCFSSLILMFIDFGQDSSLLYIPRIFGGVIIMVGILFFNEILIAHFCGLDKNTKEKISSRADEVDKLSSEVQQFSEMETANDDKEEQLFD